MPTVLIHLKRQGEERKRIELPGERVFHLTRRSPDQLKRIHIAEYVFPGGGRGRALVASQHPLLFKTQRSIKTDTGRVIGNHFKPQLSDALFS